MISVYKSDLVPKSDQRQQNSKEQETPLGDTSQPHKIYNINSNININTTGAVKITKRITK